MIASPLKVVGLCMRIYVYARMCMSVCAFSVEQGEIQSHDISNNVDHSP